MKLTRKFCGDDFDILSGDDDKTYNMMTDSGIRAAGVVSVTSNVVPGAVQKMTTLILEGNMDEAKKLLDALKPLFDIVTVKTVAQTPFGDVPVKARNPLPCKTLMNLLGMPAGPLRQPLGKMTRKGFQVVLEVARKVHENNHEILKPVEEAFDVDLSKRLYDEKSWDGLSYD
jgi:4-hydroxy-tetrahydrodipicolinate synthase